MYFCFGTQQVVAADCKNLEKSVDLILDGHKIALPELEAIIIANISSWAAGVDLWGCIFVLFNFIIVNVLTLALCGNDKRQQSYNDGILEVFGINSSFHMAQLQVGLSAPKMLGQANVVEVYYSLQCLRKPLYKSSYYRSD